MINLSNNKSNCDNNYANITEKVKCTGCGACASICPVGAISFSEDIEGFLYPNIDNEKCINCNKCKQVCPVNNIEFKQKQNKCYALIAETDIRLKSSSGGFFSVLAEYIIDNGGYVCGAAYNSEWDVEHIIIDNKNDLDKLRRSKYVQSQIGNCYRKIKDLLENNNTVLFSGTPCQVAGLNNYLNCNYDNLLTMDIVCHGVPSSSVWQRYLKDNFNKQAITDINFRDKDPSAEILHYKERDNRSSLWVVTPTVSCNNKKIYNPSYFNGFQHNLYLRESCYQCQFAKLERVADFTVGDFWGIEEICPRMNDNIGTTLCITNNSKADNVLNKIKHNFKKKRININKLKNTTNWALKHPSIKHGNRKFFFKDFIKHEMKFDDVVYKWLNKEHWDIGIVGPYTIKNYGNNLSYISLYNTIKNLGYSVLMIERPLNSDWKPDANPTLFKYNPYIKTECAPLFKNKKDMLKLNHCVDRIVVGSDQCFNANLYKFFGKYITLDWVFDCIPKIGYSISFGDDFVWYDKITKNIVSYYLKRFNKISVREDSGVYLCEKEFDSKVDFCLDPIFLSDKNFYINLINKSDFNVREHSMFTYILDNNEYKQKIIDSVAEKLNLKINTISDARVNKQTMYVEDFLKNIYKSDFIIADSFHGICMCIILEKQFIVIPNERRGLTRFESLLKMLNLQERLVTDKSDINYLISNPIDYKIVNKILTEKKIQSLEWLKMAINSSKKTSLSSNDISKIEGNKLYNNFVMYKTYSKKEKIIKFKYEFYRTLKNITWGKLKRKISHSKEKYKKLYKMVNSIKLYDYYED